MEDMSSKNPLWINTPAGATTTERAIINVLNIITNDMYEGKVKQQQIDITNNKTEALENHNENKQAIISANDMIIALSEE